MSAAPVGRATSSRLVARSRSRSSGVAALIVIVVTLGGMDIGLARAEPDAPAIEQAPESRVMEPSLHGDADLIAIEPLSLVARGISASYERPLRAHASLAGIGAYRSAAGGDYDSSTFTAGAELRVWLRDHSDMRGPYVGLRLAVGHTRLTEDEMGFVGSATSIEQRIDVGWRFVIKNHVTIAPVIGFAIHEDFASSGRLSPIGHATAGVGLELGWLRQR